MYHLNGRANDYRVHKYPLSADPLKDPTPIVRDGYATTVGAEAMLSQIFAEVFSRKHDQPGRRDSISNTELNR